MFIKIIGSIWQALINDWNHWNNGDSIFSPRRQVFPELRYGLLHRLWSIGQQLYISCSLHRIVNNRLYDKTVDLFIIIIIRFFQWIVANSILFWITIAVCSCLQRADSITNRNKWNSFYFLSLSLSRSFVQRPENNLEIIKNTA